MLYHYIFGKKKWKKGGSAAGRTSAKMGSTNLLKFYDFLYVIALL